VLGWFRFLNRRSDVQNRRLPFPNNESDLFLHRKLSSKIVPQLPIELCSSRPLRPTRPRSCQLFFQTSEKVRRAVLVHYYGIYGTQRRKHHEILSLVQFDHRWSGFVDWHDWLLGGKTSPIRIRAAERRSFSKGSASGLRNPINPSHVFTQHPLYSGE